MKKKLVEFVGAKHAISCASGIDALLLALMACGIGPGDALFTSPFTFIAKAEVIQLLGATPVFVDIDLLTSNIDPARLSTAIETLKKGNSGTHPFPKAQNGRLKPKALIAVDLFGLPADYAAINRTSSEHGLAVIEDAAQSFGAELNGKRACSLP